MPLEETAFQQIPTINSFMEDVLSGLSRRPKTIPAKYLYDQRGSELFELICDLDEYYLTRTELSIMKQYAGQMAQAIGPGKALLELGSGSSLKTRLLIEALESPAAYVPFDISPTALQEAATELQVEFPDLQIVPVSGDFQHDFRLPDEAAFFPTETVVYFPGSTIGNLSTAEILQLMRNIRETGVGGFLVGIDLQKDVRILERAYNDGYGITAEFNLNLLHRINRELDGTFQPCTFEHRAIYNRRRQRIEMHLVSLKRQRVMVADRCFHFDLAETICTEHSYKFTIEGFTGLASQAGFRVEHCWTDPAEWFAVLYLIPRPVSPRFPVSCADDDCP